MLKLLHLKTRLRYALLLTTLLLATGILQNAFATHVIGGYIRYTRVGADKYDINLEIYRDCNSGTQIGSSIVSIFDDNGINVGNISTTIDSVVTPTWDELLDGACAEQAPNPQPCLEVRYYSRKNYTINDASVGYTLMWSVFARSGSVLNIQNAGNLSGTLVATMPAYNTYGANTSPQTKKPIPPVFCADSPIVYDLGTIEPDGDSIVYSLCTPYGTTGGVTSGPPPYPNVTWNAPYSTTDPIGGVPPLSINAETGQLVCYPPPTLGQFVIGVCTEEYRGGVLISNRILDFQVIIADCLIVAAEITDDIGATVPDDISICKGDTAQLGAITQDGYLYAWVPNKWISKVNIKDPKVWPPQTQFYKILVTDPITACFNDDVVTIHVHELSITSANDTACQFGTLPVLSSAAADVDTFGYPNITTSWYSNSTLTTLVDTGVTLQPASYGAYVPINTAGTYSLWVQASNALGCTSPAVEVKVTILPAPPAPVSSGLTICEGNPLQDLTATGTIGTLTWYSDVALTNNIGTGTTLPVANYAAYANPNLAGTYSVYVQEATSSKNCVGAVKKVDIIVKDTPNAPTAPDPSPICKGEALLNLTASGSGGTINWYSDAALTNLLGSGTTLTGAQYSSVANNNVPGDYFVYVMENLNGCPGPAQMVTIKVIDKPITPIFGPVTPVCQGTTLPDLTASGSGATITWYDGDPDSGTPNVLGTGNTLPGTAYGSAADINTPGNYTIWAKESLGTTCSAPAGFVVVTVKPTPTAPVAPSVTICETNPLPNLTASGGAGTFNWYGDAALTNLLGTGTTLTGAQYSSIANNNVAGTYSVYVTETLNGCTGIATQVNIVVNETPVAPVAPSVTVCQNSAAPALTATASMGGTLNWYSDAALTTLIGTGSPLPGSALTGVVNMAVTGTYNVWVVEQLGACPSLATQVTITVSAQPTIDPVAPVNQCATNFDLATITLTGTNLVSATITYHADGGGSAGAQLPSSVVNTSGTYYIMATIGICSFAVPVAVTINPPQDAYFTITPDTYCTSETASAPVFGAGTTPGGTFSATPSGLNFNASTGQINLAASSAGVYTFTYNTPGPCPDDHSVTITVNSQESAAFTLQASICVAPGDPNPQANVTGTPGGTWSIDGGATISASGVINLSSISTEGTYTVTYTTPSAQCGATNSETIDIYFERNSGTVVDNPTVCNSGSGIINLYNLLSGEDAGGSWSENGSSSTGGAFNAGAGTFNPSGQADATYYFIYLVAGAGPCPDASTQVEITVVSAPTATVTPNATVCNGPEAPGPFLDLTALITAGDMSGTWNDADGSGAAGSPSNLDFTGVTANQSYTFTYTLDSPDPCADVVYNVEVFVQDCSCPSVALVVAPDLCSDDDLLNLNSLLDASVTEPGTWSIINDPGGSSPAVIQVDGITFDATAADAGTYTLQFTLDNPQAGCPDFNTVDIYINPAPQAGSDGILDVCNDSGILTLFDVLGNPKMPGGYWSLDLTSPNTPNNSKLDYALGTFDVLGHKGGSFIFSYTVEGNPPCVNDLSLVTINIDELPNVVWNAATPLCNTTGGGSTINLTTLIKSSVGINGTWADTDNAAGNGATVNFPNVDFNNAQAGTYTFTYTLQSANNICGPKSFTIDIVVNDCTCPDLSMGLPPVLCNSTTTNLDAIKITTQPGTWTISSAPSGGTPGYIEADGKTFNAVGAQVGTYIITFTLTNAVPPGCAKTTTITIFVVNNTDAGWINPGTICTLSPVINLNSILSPVATPGGLWTINGTPATTFDPAALGPGTYAVTYDVGTPPCQTSNTKNIVVIKSGDPSWNTPGSICQSVAAIALNTLLAPTADTGGTWTIGGNVVTQFDPALYPVGPVNVTYSVGTVPCESSITQAINVIAQPIANISPIANTCVNEAASINFSGAANAGTTFNWTFNGGTPATATGNGPHNIIWSAAGTYTVTLITTEGGCTSEPVTANVVVESPLPLPVINCATTTSSITFSWNAVPGSSGYLVSIDGGPPFPTGATSYSATGLFAGQSVTITVEAVSAGACPNSVGTQTCIAEDCPPVTLDITPIADICLTASTTAFDIALNIVGGNGSGTTTWSGTGITNTTSGTFDPVLAGPGAHNILCNYQQGNCQYNQPVTINVYTTPTTNFTLSNTNVCANGIATITATYTGNASVGATYTWNFDGATVVSGTGAGPYTLSFATPGTYDITLDVTENGCASPQTIITVNAPAPLATPQISCGTLSTSSVEFIWLAVPGAVSYDITYTINGGPPINDNTTNTNYLITGLSVSDIVDITVVAVGPAPCGNSAPGTGQCEAKDCPPITPTIDVAITTYCTSDAAITLTATPSGGTFSGTGVSGTNFDPAIAGPGTHTVTYNYVDAVSNCPYTATLNLTVNQTPTANFTLAATDWCADGTSQLLVDYTGNASAGATFNWNFAGGVATPSGLDQLVAWPSGTGTVTVSLQVTENGCTSTVFTADVNLSEPLPAPVVTCSGSQTDQVSFDWPDVPGATGYDISYTINGGAPQTDNTPTSNYTVTGLSVNDMVDISVVALSNGPCGNSPAGTGQCQAKDCPVITPTITGLAANYCTADAIVTLTLSPAGGVLTGPGVIAPNQFDPALAGQGNFSIVYTYTDPATQCEYIISQLTEVNLTPDSSFGIADATICSTGKTQITANDIIIGATYDWNFDGGVAFPGTSFGPHEVTWATGGTKTVTLTITNKGCVSPEGTSTIDVVAPLFAPNVICSAQSTNDVSFSWDPIPGATGYEVTISGDVPTKTENVALGSETYAVTGLTPGNVVNISIIALGPPPCGNSAPGTATCIAQDCPTITPTITLPKTTYCSNEAAVNIVLNPVGGTLTGNGVVAGMFDPAIAGPGVHTLDYNYTDIATGCSYAANINITVTEQPSAAFTTNATTICIGESITFTPSGNIAGGNGTWDFGGLGSANATSEQSFTFNEAGNFIISFTVDNNGCTDTQTQAVEVSGVTVKTIDDTQILAGTTLELTTQATSALNGTLSFAWTDAMQLITDLTMQSPSITSNEAGEFLFTITATDQYGCSATDEVTVKVIKENKVIAPNAFTPNSDGKNDVFNLVGSNITSYSLAVYDRWGTLLFENPNATPTSGGWDGTKNGKLMDVGTYVYSAKVTFGDGKTKEIKGNIALIR
ncbi:MAG: gliding motility-associated C-terminal domain-containing protein [Sphingobacteriales bacterium]|nr:gliding motility-associated C-terminal domain-containing protein [Sphingobacteriales bacterium]MBK7526608.1 gliding motility-associated C-terminal domain-containing protein [Sphingobacteriales bacterium]MBL0248390.1 gliding motility-associated C-terminal domain-containing protein [Sphingobacteriales bacterium]MBP9141673.1 gliding motility-associated C-terminal domain-containing protein [Chitinophagales bacterium]MCC7057619.1 gliding motility-associated C-terminal domain-containing protein [C